MYIYYKFALHYLLMKMKSGTTLLLLLLFISAQISVSQTSPHPVKKTVYGKTPASKTPASNEIATKADTLKSKDYYLELKGTVRQLKGNESENAKEENVKPLDSALVTIYSGDVPYSEFWTNKKGKCSFKLPLDKNFKIQISKEGFVTKYIFVSTKIPESKKDVFSFNFDVDIFQELRGLDVSVLKNPIAKVSYNIPLEGFAYDVNYTNRINSDLKKMYKDYYKLQKMAIDTAYRDSTELVPKIPPDIK
ncbi:MAG: hypothetical protein JWP12_3707 [Bacteroidetes bacterium]|nr:hypothetical protein [Bacteroidota bacterium]